MPAIVIPRNTSSDSSRVDFSVIISPMFSDIVQRFETALNPLYRERDARHARGLSITDLVSGNVNRAGFIFPETVLSQALAKGARAAKIYSPDPLGQRVAREAVSGYYRRRKVAVPPA